MDKNDLLAMGKKKFQQFRKKKENKGKSSKKTGKSEGVSDQEAAAAAASDDTPESPLSVERERESESVSSQGVHAESSDSLEPQSTEKNLVGTDVEVVIVDQPVQEVVPERPSEMVVDDGDGSKVQCDADSSLSVDVEVAGSETAPRLEHEEEQCSSIPPLDESVVAGEEVVHPDAEAENSTVSSDSQDREKESLVPQRLSTNENQEADCLGSIQCDGRDKESHELQDIDGLETGYISVEPEGEQESFVAGHGESSKDIAGVSPDLLGTSPDLLGTGNLADEGEGAVKGETDLDLLANINTEGTHESATSVPVRDTDESVGSSFTQPKDGIEGEDCVTEGTGDTDTDAVAVHSEVDFSVCTDAISKGVGPEEDKEETTTIMQGTNGGDLDAVDSSSSPVTDHEEDGTQERSGAQLEEGRENLSSEKEIEVRTEPYDTGFDYKDGAQADMESDRHVDSSRGQQIPFEEAVAVSIMQKDPLDRDLVTYGSQGRSPCIETRPVDLSELAEVIKGLNEEEVRQLLNVRPLTFDAGLEDMSVSEKRLGDGLETLKTHLYFTVVAKDLFQLQLSEQMDCQMEFDQRDSQLRNQVANLNSALKENQDCSTNLSQELMLCRSHLQAMGAGKDELEIQLTGSREELAQCRSDLQAMAIGKEELEAQFTIAREEEGKITARCFELQTQLERSHEEMAKVFAELASCRGSKEALETEISNLRENLSAAVDYKTKIDTENTHLLHENERLATQLLDQQEGFSKEKDKCAQFEDDLKEATARFEQLTQEKMFLSSSLDVHKAKLEEMESLHSQLVSQATEARYQSEGLEAPKMQLNPTNDEYSLEIPHQVVERDGSGLEESTFALAEEKPTQPLEGGGLVDSVEFLDFKTYFDEVEKTMQKLENEIDRVRSHSLSLSRSGGKVPGAGVSKLIQAFELKVNHDENDPTELPLGEGEKSTEDHFALVKQQTSILRDILKKLDLGVRNVSEDLKEEKSNRKLASVALSELQVLYGASEKQISDFEERIIELVNNLSDHQSRTDEMHHQLNTMEKKSEEMQITFFNEVDNLKKDTDSKLSMLEQEWNFTISEICKTVNNLDESIGSLPAIAYPVVQYDDLNVVSRIAASIDAANKVIADLHANFGAASTGLMKMQSSYESLNEKFSDLYIRNGLATELLGMVYGELEKIMDISCDDVRESDVNLKDENLLPDLLHPSKYMYLLNQLMEMAGERLQFKSAQSELKAELINRTQEFAELKEKCIDSKSVLKLVEYVKHAVELDVMDAESDTPIVSHLESLIGILVQKYKEASEQVSCYKGELELEVMKFSETQAKANELSSLRSHQEEEIHILKKRLREMDGIVEDVRANLQVKGAELEQSEQRVSSVREKLSIAVAKGKGLIVQRDNLKQSLTDMSSELERCTQEIQSKDAKLREVEAKLKTYSEAERIEALESELSYIRNSATALRESFLLKDSVIQRIEEVLEELELPEQFHSRDIVEKIEWLARSVSGNSSSMTEWHQKNPDEGGSYSDAGFVVTDGWKEDTHQSPRPGLLEDLKRRNEELQSKFYGFAEQNEMLEQSLMERNKLVQRWEEILNRIDMPMQLRSMDTEEKIEWLGTAVSEAHHDRDFLVKKVESFELECESLASGFENSKRKISDLELALQDVTQEKEALSENLENLSRDKEKILEKVAQHELEKRELLDEVASVQDKLGKQIEKDDHCQHVTNQIKRLHVLVSDVLQDQSEDGRSHDVNDTEDLEGLLRKLIENYMALSLEKSTLMDVVEKNNAGESVMVLNESENDVAQTSQEHEQVVLKEEFDEVLSKLADEKLEREKILGDFEALGRQKDELQERLNQEEMKLASTREKLNVAVRKGKGLVQQRDSLKQTIDEMKRDMDDLRKELDQRESALVQDQQKIRELSSYPEKAENLERECLFLQSNLTDMEHTLQNTGHTLSSLVNMLNDIDIGAGLDVVDPIRKMESVGKFCHDLQASLASSEHETKKSRRATELLLAELDEVHERADGLQEELLKAESALARVSEERDLAEAAREEALSRLENVIIIPAEDRKKEFAELIRLKTDIDEMRKGCGGFINLLTDVLSVDLELLSNVEDGVRSLLKQMDGNDLSNLPPRVAPGAVLSVNSANEVSNTSLEMDIKENSGDYSIFDVLGLIDHSLQGCRMEGDTLREKCYKHTVTCGHQVKRILKAMEAVHEELTSGKESLESANRDFKNFESLRMEKDSELSKANRMVTLLYKACISSISEIENQKGRLAQDGVYEHENKGMDHNEHESLDGETSFTEERVKSIAEKLLLAVKDSASIQAEIVSNNQQELKAIILNLQKELQENDIQKNRICSELVGQIKEAESNSKNYLVELQAANDLVVNLEKQVNALQKERDTFELRIKELQDGESLCSQLKERIVALNDLLTAKGQETEDLMQALDEEESQMEGLRHKIEELEKTLQQKNLALKNLEGSHGKGMAKLSTTLSKFDELHLLSESLLSEIENLQSQLQERDDEISFLRQEVTRCTNDALLASQHSNKKDSTEMHELLSELEASRLIAQNKDALLQVEKKRIAELSNKIASLEGSINLGELTSEIIEVEPLINKRGVVATSRNARKANEQVAINIDADHEETTVDEDDDKVHGFKSLTTSRIVPRFTRPVSDLIDGLWVSCDRALMRQPALRLGIVLYWIMLHSLIASAMI